MPYGYGYGRGGRRKLWRPLSGAVVDLDFVRDRYFQAGVGTGVGLLSVTRASAGVAERTIGVWDSFAAGALRRTDKGLLVERSRTNSLRNSACQGYSVGVDTGSGGAPTNWGNNGAISGITQQIVGGGAEDGLDYVDWRVAGTNGSGGSATAALQFETTTSVVAAQGEFWNASVFHKLSSGSFAGFSGATIAIFERDSAGAFLVSATAALTPIATRQRAALTRTIASATAARVNSKIELTIPSGAAVDITIRVFAPQLEKVPFATSGQSSPIRTAGATATRAHDVIALLASTGISLAQGTVFAEYQEAIAGPIGESALLWNLRVDGSNFMQGYKSGSNGFLNGQIYESGASRGSIATTAFPAAGALARQAFAYAAGDAEARYSNGLGSGGVVAPASLPTGGFTLHVGSFGGASNFLNAYLRRLAIFPTRKPTGDLTAWALG